MRKRNRLILLVVIFLALGGVVYKVAESLWIMNAQEIRRNPLRVLDSLPESALQLKDFRRAKIEEGRKIWELFGEEANYFKEQKEAVIKKPRFFYYNKKGEVAETTGETARLFFGEKELVAANGLGPVQAVDNAMRKVLEKHYPQLSEVRLEEFDVRLLHHGGTAQDEEDKGAGALVRVLAIFSDGSDRWGTVGVAADILQASVECIIDGLEWKLRGEQKH